MLLSQVKQINPLLNPKPVELGIGSYAGTEGSQANTNLSNISNVLPFALPMATMGLMSQAPNIINKEISAQDVIDNHLNRDYKTYEGGYNINEASIYTPQGVIHQPDPVDPETLEEWKRRNILSTPIYEPNIDDYSTGGDQPEINIPNSTGSPPVDLNLPTHTGSPPVEANIPNILYNKDLEEVIDDGLLSEKAPPFYSKITKTIEDAQMNKASGDGWMGMINNSGVNQDELDWIGMKDFLADKKSVTKEEILDFAKMNDLSTEVKEVILGEANNPNTNVIKKNTNAIDVSLANVEDYDDATLIVMNNERLYNEFQDFLADTKADLQVDEIDSLVEDDYLEEFLRAKGVSKEKSTLPTIFNDTNLITEGDYTDYKEMTFALPNIDADFTKGHYKGKNIFAHARFNTRDIDGKKTLFIEELQSDWVHKGKDAGFKDDNKYQELRKEQQRLFEIQSNIGKDIKEQGFDGTAEQQKIYIDADNAYKEIQNELDATSDAVPDLPFKKNWQDIVLKRMIRYASENGFDSIAMTGGNIQKDRYDLSKQIDSIQVNASDKAEGKIHVVAGNEIDLHIYPNQLEEHIGKDLAKKINNDIEEKNILKDYKLKMKEFMEYDSELEKKYKLSKKTIGQSMSAEETEKYDKLDQALYQNNNLEYKGLDLRVGGEGLGQMYDKIFNKSLKKIGKKHGAEVELKNINRKKSIFSKNARFNYENTVLKDASNIEEALKLASNNKYLKDEFEIYLRVDKGDEISPEERKEILEQSTINGIKKSSSLMLNFLQEDYGLSANSVAHNELIKDDKLNMWYMNLTDSLKKQSIEAGMPIAFNKPVNPLFNYA
jgi:hypothetical protein